MWMCMLFDPQNVRYQVPHDQNFTLGFHDNTLHLSGQLKRDHFAKCAKMPKASILKLWHMYNQWHAS